MGVHWLPGYKLCCLPFSLFLHLKLGYGSELLTGCKLCDLPFLHIAFVCYAWECSHYQATNCATNCYSFTLCLQGVHGSAVHKILQTVPLVIYSRNMISARFAWECSCCPASILRPAFLENGHILPAKHLCSRKWEVSTLWMHRGC